MVSSKMTAVLAVAFLLLCSNVRCSAEEVQATVTQVKVSDPPTTAPAITNTTEGSSDSHSAVLANEVLGDSDPLVLVDLARSNQENMTSMSATPPTADSVPSGFDLNEPDDSVPESFAESTTPPSVAAAPGFDMNEFAGDSQSLAATEDQGTLVHGFPGIGSSVDNSHGQGYGVQMYDASSATTVDDLSLAATQDQGTLVHGFPGIESSEGNSQGSFSSVQTFDEYASGADSLSAYQEDEYPLEHEDITGGPDMGAVRPYGPFYGQP